MSVSVRMAELNDVDAIVDFGARVVPPHYSPILGADAAQGQLAWWTRECMEPAVTAGRVHVALANHAVVGLSETGEFNGEQVIWKLYLAPDFRGGSLGTELLRHSIDALPAGVGHVLVEHFAGNARAGTFYQREGFNVIHTEAAHSDDQNAAVVWRRLELEN